MKGNSHEQWKDEKEEKQIPGVIGEVREGQLSDVIEKARHSFKKKVWSTKLSTESSRAMNQHISWAVLMRQECEQGDGFWSQITGIEGMIMKRGKWW